MQLVFLLEPAQDRDRILDRRLADEHRLEPPRQRRVLFDMLPVFVERGRADAMQFAARQGRLQQIGGVHRAVGLARADQRVHLVDEQDHPARRRRDLVQHRLDPLLELAAIFRAGDQRAHVERQQLLVLQRLRHVAVDDAQGEALDDGGLADAGFADQHGIVFRAPRQNLNGPADFLVAADHRIELALARRLGQIAGVFLQGVVAAFGRGAVGLAALAQILDGRVERLRGHAGLAQNARGLGPLLQREREQQPLDRDKAVAGLLRDLLGVVEQPRGRRRQIELHRAGARHLRQFGEDGLGLLQRLARASASLVDQPRRKPLLVVEQRLQNMLGRELLMALAGRDPLRRLNEAARPLGVFLDIHECSPIKGRPPMERRVTPLAPCGGPMRDMGMAFRFQRGRDEASREPCSASSGEG